MIRTDQVSECGRSRQYIVRKVAAGDWAQLLPHVYGLASVPDSWDRRAEAALLWAGPEGTICGEAAGYINKILDRPPEVIDISLPKQRQAPAPWANPRRLMIQDVDRLKVGRLTVMAPARTLVDLFAVLGPTARERALDRTIRSGGASPARIRWTLERVGIAGRKGTGDLVRMLNVRQGLSHTQSDLEDLVRRLIRRYKMPPAVEQRFLKDKAMEDPDGTAEMIWEGIRSGGLFPKFRLAEQE